MPLLGQWGITQDDFGRLFYNTNSDQLRGDLLPSRFAASLNRASRLEGVNVRIANDQTVWPIRATPGVNRGYKEGFLRQDGTLVAFTAASAPLIYRGTHFPASFVGNAFVPEPAANLVKRNLLLETAGRITAINAYDQADFLASTDERFRPVFLADAPDGALYVVDFYRGMLEGYASTTTYLREQILARKLIYPLWGLGRIWRVVHDSGARAVRPDFVKASPREMVELLTHANGWVRDTAQRLLVESGRREVAPLLRGLLTRAPKSRDRATALWCLEGLGQLAVPDVLRGYDDADPKVRIAAIQASEPMLRSAAGAPLVAKLRNRVGIEEPMVLANAVLAVDASSHPSAQGFLRSVLLRAAEDPALADATLLALRGHEVEVLERLTAAGDTGLFGRLKLLESLGARLVLAGGPAVEALTTAIVNADLSQPGRLALMRGALLNPGVSLPAEALAKLASSSPDPIVRSGAERALERARERTAGVRARAPASPLTPAQQALFDDGRSTFALCSACHQGDGNGYPGLAPSLRGSRWANALSPESAIRIVLNGKEGTSGFPAPMTPFSSLSDRALAGVLTYIRRSFGNDASAVEPADVARLRREVGDRANAWTDRELARFAGEQE